MANLFWNHDLVRPQHHNLPKHVFDCCRAILLFKSKGQNPSHLECIRNVLEHWDFSSSDLLTVWTFVVEELLSSVICLNEGKSDITVSKVILQEDTWGDDRRIFIIFSLEVMSYMVRHHYRVIKLDATLRVALFMSIAAEDGFDPDAVPSPGAVYTDKDLFRLRLQCLRALTQQGKALSPFGTKIGPLLLRWLGAATVPHDGHHRSRLQQKHHIYSMCLPFIIQIVKYSWRVIEESGCHELFVQKICDVSIDAAKSNMCQESGEKIVLLSMRFVEELVRRGALQYSEIEQVLFFLCLAVNRQSNASYSVLRNILTSTQYAHTAMTGLLNILVSPHLSATDVFELEAQATYELMAILSRNHFQSFVLPEETASPKNFCQVDEYETGNSKNTDVEETVKMGKIRRGAVFFISSSLWGVMALQSLGLYWGTAMCTFYKVVSTYSVFSREAAEDRVVLVQEILLSIHRLINKHGHVLHAEWNVLLAILLSVEKYLPISHSSFDNLNKLAEKNKVESWQFSLKQDEWQHTMKTVLIHSLLDCVRLYESSQFAGNPEWLFGVVHAYMHIIPPEAGIIALKYRSTLSHPSMSNWGEHLILIAREFFSTERDLNLRLATLDVIIEVISDCGGVGEDQEMIINDVIFPYFERIYSDMYESIRLRGIDLIKSACIHASFGNTISSEFPDSCRIGKKYLNGKISPSSGPRPPFIRGVGCLLGCFEEAMTQTDYSDVRVHALVALCELFVLWLPGARHALLPRITSMIVDVACNDESPIEARKISLDFIGQFSANHKGQVIFSSNQNFLLNMNVTNHFDRACDSEINEKEIVGRFLFCFCTQPEQKLRYGTLISLQSMVNCLTTVLSHWSDFYSIEIDYVHTVQKSRNWNSRKIQRINELGGKLLDLFDMLSLSLKATRRFLLNRFVLEQLNLSSLGNALLNMLSMCTKDFDIMHHNHAFQKIQQKRDNTPNLSPVREDPLGENCSKSACSEYGFDEDSSFDQSEGFDFRGRIQQLRYEVCSIMNLFIGYRSVFVRNIEDCNSDTGFHGVVTAFVHIILIPAEAFGMVHRDSKNCNNVPHPEAPHTIFIQFIAQTLKRASIASAIPENSSDSFSSPVQSDSPKIENFSLSKRCHLSIGLENFTPRLKLDESDDFFSESSIIDVELITSALFGVQIISSICPDALISHASVLAKYMCSICTHFTKLFYEGFERGISSDRLESNKYMNRLVIPMLETILDITTDFSCICGKSKDFDSENLVISMICMMHFLNLLPDYFLDSDQDSISDYNVLIRRQRILALKIISAVLNGVGNKERRRIAAVCNKADEFQHAFERSDWLVMVVKDMLNCDWSITKRDHFESYVEEMQWAGFESLGEVIWKVGTTLFSARPGIGSSLGWIQMTSRRCMSHSRWLIPAKNSMHSGVNIGTKVLLNQSNKDSTCVANEIKLSQTGSQQLDSNSMEDTELKNENKNLANGTSGFQVENTPLVNKVKKEDDFENGKPTHKVQGTQIEHTPSVDENSNLESKSDATGLVDVWYILENIIGSTLVPGENKEMNENSGKCPSDCSTIQVLQVSEDSSNRTEIDRSIAYLDRIPSLEIHKIALLYTGEKFPTEVSLIGYDGGSPRFCTFLENFGGVFPLKTLGICSGGLDLMGSDGEYTLSTSIDNSVVLFHVPALMPLGLHARKRHVGNDFVHIIFSESEADYDSNIVQGAFGFVSIVVSPYQNMGECKISVLVRSGSNPLINNLESVCIVAISEAPKVALRLALKCDIACRTLFEDHIGQMCNVERRLQEIVKLGK